MLVLVTRPGFLQLSMQKEFSVQLGNSFAVNVASLHDHAVGRWLQLLLSMSVYDSFM